MAKGKQSSRSAAAGAISGTAAEVIEAAASLAAASAVAVKMRHADDEIAANLLTLADELRKLL